MTPSEFHQSPVSGSAAGRSAVLNPGRGIYIKTQKACLWGLEMGTGSLNRRAQLSETVITKIDLLSFINEGENVNRSTLHEPETASWPVNPRFCPMMETRPGRALSRALVRRALVPWFVSFLGQ